ncbi:MAG: hypothetical protein AAF752_11490 [Bacteroidota bacterium]
MRIKTSKSADFSTYLSKVTFDGSRLIIQGRKRLTSILLFAFLLACIWCLTLEFPLLVKAGIVLAIVIVAYGVVDVGLSKSLLIYDVRKKRVDVERRSLRKQFRYYGPANHFLNVRKVVSPGSDGFDTDYTVQLVFDDGQVRIPYPLVNVTLSEAAAEKKVAEWQAQLELG